MIIVEFLIMLAILIVILISTNIIERNIKMMRQQNEQIIELLKEIKQMKERK